MKGNGKGYIGQLVIRQGEAFMEPSVVYVHSWSDSMEDVVCEVVNEGISCFGGYFEPYDYKRLKELETVWKIENNEQEHKWLEQNLLDLV